MAKRRFVHKGWELHAHKDGGSGITSCESQQKGNRPLRAVLDGTNRPDMPAFSVDVTEREFGDSAAEARGQENTRSHGDDDLSFRMPGAEVANRVGNFM